MSVRIPRGNTTHQEPSFSTYLLNTGTVQAPMTALSLVGCVSANERRLVETAPTTRDSRVLAEGPHNLTALPTHPVFAVGTAPRAAYAVFVKYAAGVPGIPGIPCVPLRR